MRLLGAALVAAAGVLCGLFSAGELRRELTEMDGFSSLLERLSMELTRFKTPLPELFFVLSEELSGPAGRFCRTVAVGLSADVALPVLWRSATEPLPGELRELLLPLGTVLGRYGAEEQAESAALVRERLDRRREEKERRLRDRTRVRVGVFAAGGALLAVLLL